MDGARLAAIALGLVWLWAGVAKLADRRWPAAAAGFGVAPRVGWFVAPVELLLGAALVGGSAARASAAASIALLIAYIVVLVRQLRSGRDAPPCACFGGWSARPVSWRTVARNAALVVLAVVVLAG